MSRHATAAPATTTDAGTVTPPPRGAVAAITWLAMAACGVVAAWVMFDRLGGDRMWGDEATYALIVDHARTTGDYVRLSASPPDPYFDKPPLGIWLTAATRDAISAATGGGFAAYRAWSAAFGVASAVLTCALAAAWFGPGVGAVAGLLLALNPTYLYFHGARHGGFDTGVVACVLAAALPYTAHLTRRLGPRAAWAGVGVALGLASLFKPFVGVPALGLIAVHALAFDRPAPRRSTLARTGLALAALLLVAAPWYAVQWALFGDAFVDRFFRTNLAERIAIGVDPQHLHGFAFYWRALYESSAPFAWYPLAIAVLIVPLVRRSAGDPRGIGLVLVMGLGWVALFSLSPSKWDHYIYPAYPFVAAMLAAAGGGVLRGVVGRWPAARPLVVPAVAVVLPAAFALAAARLVYVEGPGRQTPHAAWGAYHALEPAIRAGHVDFVRHALPSGTGLPNDLRLYLNHMPADVETTTPEHLAARLAAGRPTLLVAWSPSGAASDAVAASGAAVDPRWSAAGDAVSVYGLNLGPVLSPAFGPPPPREPTAAAQWTVTPTFAGAATLLVTVRYAGDPPPHVVWQRDAGGAKRASLPVASSGPVQRFVVPVKFAARHVGRPTTLSFAVRDAAGGAPVAFHATAAELRYAPVAPDRPRGSR
ncbi:MAG TPA: glycosyltransferase family 39 protein [Tepidisphaeraceae bacterium]|nr:glycosyltransferase family 39 protein [Tepidisphaeraceae bacterium]